MGAIDLTVQIEIDGEGERVNAIACSRGPVG